MTVGLIRESLKHCERKTEKSRTEILTNNKQKYEVQQKFEVLQFHTDCRLLQEKKYKSIQSDSKNYEILHAP